MTNLHFPGPEYLIFDKILLYLSMSKLSAYGRKRLAAKLRRRRRSSELKGWEYIAWRVSIVFCIIIIMVLVMRGGSGLLKWLGY